MISRLSNKFLFQYTFVITTFTSMWKYFSWILFRLCSESTDTFWKSILLDKNSIFKILIKFFDAHNIASNLIWMTQQKNLQNNRFFYFTNIHQACQCYCKKIKAHLKFHIEKILFSEYHRAKYSISLFSN